MLRLGFFIEGKVNFFLNGVNITCDYCFCSETGSFGFNYDFINGFGSVSEGG